CIESVLPVWLSVSSAAIAYQEGLLVVAMPGQAPPRQLAPGRDGQVDHRSSPDEALGERLAGVADLEQLPPDRGLLDGLLVARQRLAVLERVVDRLGGQLARLQ